MKGNRGGEDGEGEGQGVAELDGQGKRNVGERNDLEESYVSR